MNPEESIQERKKRILLIEDDPATRLVLLNKLRTAGFDVDVAIDGRLGIEKLRNSQFDAIFMDLLLPNVKGVEVIKIARRHPGFGKRPIYVCTSAANMSAWTRRATKAGATRVFDRATTPIDTTVAEVAMELKGVSPNATPPETVSSDEGKSEALGAAPNQVTTPNVAALAEPQHPQAQPQDHALPTSESHTQPFSSMKRLLKTLGLSRSSDPPAAPASPTPALPTPESANTNPSDEASANIPATQAVSPPEQNPSDLPDACPLEGTHERGSGEGVAVITVDGAGAIQSADAACGAMFGWDAAALVGRNLEVLVAQ